MNVDRASHLAWCKMRALEYVEANDLRNAWTSMASDMSKHPETKDHPTIKLGMIQTMTGGLSTKEEMKKFIECFN